MKFKITTIDNSKGLYDKIIFSSLTSIDFFKNLITVRLYNLNSEDYTNLISIDYYSTTIIMESNQAQNNSFMIPIGSSKYRIEVMITIDSDIQVDDITILLQ